MIYMEGGFFVYLMFMLIIAGVSFLTGFIKLVKRKRHDYPYFLFLLLICSVSLFVLSAGSTFTGIYLRFPHLWRLFSALGFLNPLLSFLFLRVLLTNRQKFLWSDLWFALPALIHLVNMTPFLFSDTETKLAAVKSVMKDGNSYILETEGFLLKGLNAWLRAFIAISVLFGQVIVLIAAGHHFRHGDGSIHPEDRKLYHWLWLMTLMLAFSVLLVLFQFTMNIFPGWDMLHIIPIAISSVLYLLVGTLLFFPKMLNGFKYPLAPSDLIF